MLKRQGEGEVEVHYLLNFLGSLHNNLFWTRNTVAQDGKALVAYGTARPTPIHHYPRFYRSGYRSGYTEGSNLQHKRYPFLSLKIGCFFKRWPDERGMYAPEDKVSDLDV